jgi:hypothetical protein
MVLPSVHERFDKPLLCSDGNSAVSQVELGSIPRPSPAQIALPGEVVKMPRAQTALERHGLPLAVGGLHSSKLSLELRERRRLVAQALRDRLSRHIRRDHESAVAASLLDNVGALDIAAQFHVRLIHGG